MKIDEFLTEHWKNILIIILIVLLIATNITIEKPERKPRTETYLGKVDKYEICDYQIRPFAPTMPQFPKDYYYDCWIKYNNTEK